MRDKGANYGVCKANFVLAQKETKNVSHMSPKSGQSVLKKKETKGTLLYFMLYAFALLYAFYFMSPGLLLYALCLCFTLSSTSFMLPNQHVPPSIAFLLLINLKANKHRLACWLKSSQL